MRLILAFCLDIIVAFAAVICAFKISPSFTKEIIVGWAIDHDVLPVALGMAFAIGLALYVISADALYLRIGWVELTVRMAIGCMTGGVLFSALYSLANNQLYGRYVF